MITCIWLALEIFYEEAKNDYSNALNRLEYSIVITSHTLEKGFSHFKLRPFGVKK